MPGENCCIPGCHVYRDGEKYPDIGLFKLPMYSGQFYEERRQKLVVVLLKFRDAYDKGKGIRKRRWTHL